MAVRSIHAFAEKVALVTNAETPVGRAVSIQLALNGCFVVASTPKSGGMKSPILGELRSLGTLANLIEADRAAENTEKEIIDEIEKIYGRLDILVNVAGEQSGVSYESLDEGTWSELMAGSLSASFFLVRYARKLMDPRPKPRILSIIRRSGYLLEEMANAAAMKMAEGMARGLPKNYRINCISYFAGPAGREEGNSNQEPQGKATPPDDIARAALYLLSPEAIAINGETLNLS